jgi:2-oxoglutarate dehydrogenase E2 component (dihydrolipoamide succinyltransferase)
MTMDIRVPEMGESVVGATVAHWRKQEGEPVAAGEAVVELETEKVDLEVAADRSGVLARIVRHEGDEVKIGEVLGLLEEAPAGAPAEASAPAAAPEAAQALLDVTPAAPPEPAAARVAPAAPPERAVTPPARPADQPASPPEPPAPVPLAPEGTLAGKQDRREERVRMSRRRQTIARRLIEAQQTAAMLSTFNEVDMGPVMALRGRHRQAFEARHGVRLGITAFFVKAAVAALKVFPRLNAEIQGDELILKHFYDIGIAVGAAEGLVVPVLRDADRLSLAEIEQAVKRFAHKAEDGSLSLEDLRGGTFTLTNGGVFGSLLSTPILNPPQVGILGLHTIQDRPVAVAGEVAIHPMMYLALTYDHRIVDGREAVQFLVRVKELIESPETLLLEG